MSNFADRLADAVRQRACPVLVGLDPRFEQLPEPIRGDVAPNDGAAVARCYQTFCEGIIDVVAPLVPAVKPQMAFFEELGPPGMEALAAIVRYARQQGLLVILDGKRNDIGSTATAYARAYLGSDSPWQADALTVSPYLGDDSLAPFIQTCLERHAGIFVLVKTSNPGSGMFQDVRDHLNQLPLYTHVAHWVERQAASHAGKSGFGPIGAVVGATYPTQLAELRDAMPHTWMLIPGYGAQGAGATDVAAGFDSHGMGAIVNSSRGIIFAHARPEFRPSGGESKWQEAVAASTRAMIDELRSDTPAGKLR